jgi:predicted dehydrogenase
MVLLMCRREGSNHAAGRASALTGTRGTATLAGTALEVRWHDGRTESLAPDGSGGGTGADPMAFPHDYHRSVWRDFLDAVQGGGEPRVNGEEALRVHRLIDALLASAATVKAIHAS